MDRPQLSSRFRIGLNPKTGEMVGLNSLRSMMAYTHRPLPLATRRRHNGAEVEIIGGAGRSTEAAAADRYPELEIWIWVVAKA